MNRISIAIVAALLAAVGIALANAAQPLNVAKFFGPYYYYYYAPPPETVEKAIKGVTPTEEVTATTTPPEVTVKPKVVAGAATFDASEYVVQGVVSSSLILETPDKAVRAYIPSLTLTSEIVESLVISIREIPPTEVTVPEGYSVIRVYRIDAESEKGRVELLAPGEGIRLRFRVSLADVKDPARLVIIHVMTGNKTRILVPSISIEGGYVVLTVTVPRLSIFVIAEKQEAAKAPLQTTEETKPKEETTEETQTTQPTQQPAQQTQQQTEQTSAETVEKAETVQETQQPTKQVTKTTTETTQVTQPKQAKTTKETKPVTTTEKPSPPPGPPITAMIAIAVIIAAVVIAATLLVVRRRRTI